MLARLQTLRDLIPNNVALPHNMLPVRQMWQERIHLLMQDFIMPGNTTRPKRGLFNFIGYASNKLFGTATENQVSQLQAQIDELALQDQRVTHAYNDLITVVNQTHGFVARNTQHINRIEQFAASLAGTLRTQLAQVAGNTGMLNHLLQRTQIGELLASLEALHSQWSRHADQFRDQRRSLEAGWLTEDILPAKDLYKVLQTARTQGLHTPHITWYYEHVRIHAFWENQHQLVFKAALPLLEAASYLRYTFSSWPVPTSPGTFRFQLQVPPDIAIHTATGVLFQPSLCLGQSPQICRPGPLYDHTHFTCARGILSGDQHLRRECKVTLSHPHASTNITTIQEIHPGVYIISSPGETFRILCMGRIATSNVITPGVFMLSLQPGCRAQGSGWTVVGIIDQQEALHVPFTAIALLPLNITPPALPHIIATTIQHPQFIPAPPIPDVHLHHLQDFHLSTTTVTTTEAAWWGAPLSWVSLIISLITLAAVWKSGHWCARAKLVIPTLRRKSRKRRRTQEASPEAIPMPCTASAPVVPLAPQTHSQPPITAPLWPDLSKTSSI